MRLQARVNGRKHTPKGRRSRQEVSDNCSNSDRSIPSRDSIDSRKDKKENTCLQPTDHCETNDNHVDPPVRNRRHSAGGFLQSTSTEMMPIELVKRPIKPMGVPLATSQICVPVVASTEHELIVSKIDAMEERKDPERQWTKVTRYTVYAARGFGTFSPVIGIGVYGAELQKAIRRQANGLKHTLWNLKIRVPITNRIATGIALMRWGSEDGRHSGKDTIMLGDCYPMDSHNFETFKLSGDKIEDHGKQPSTVHMFVKMARQQSRLYAAAYGSEHLHERLEAVDRLNDIHDECPEFSHQAS